MLLFILPSRLACRLRLVDTGGATVESPRIAAWRNDTRSETTRRDGRVFGCAPHCVVEGKSAISRGIRMASNHTAWKCHLSNGHETRRTCSIRFPISLTNRGAVGTASLKERSRNEGARLLYRQRYSALDAGRMALMVRHSSPALIGHTTLELLRSDWLNIEPLVLDNPRPMYFISKSSKRTCIYSLVHDRFGGERLSRV